MRENGRWRKEGERKGVICLSLAPAPLSFKSRHSSSSCFIYGIFSKLSTICDATEIKGERHNASCIGIVAFRIYSDPCLELG